MMRACHLNTCPVGIATQDPELRKNFKGKPEHVINFMHFVAEELRTIMAELGFRTMNEMIGQSQKINMNETLEHYKTKHIDLSNILYKPSIDKNVSVKNNSRQDHKLENVLDFKILNDSKEAIKNNTSINLSYKIKNTDRTVGAILSNEISKIYGIKGLEENSINISFQGVAGQSFGAFSVKGLTLAVTGNTNDYFGKGLSGAKIIVKIPSESTFKSNKNVITGNVALYGATSGKAYINGMAGERFCVRNSGATAVVEGIGDHGCEYMTGGIALILGDIGRNFAAGMSGGIAYIYKEGGDFDERNFNMEMIEFEEPNSQDLDLIKKNQNNLLK